jgi:hypothetical protein
MSAEQMSGRQTESQEQWHFKYHVTESKYPFAFYLDDGSVYVSVHFDGQHFGHPGTKEDIAIRDFLEKMKIELHANMITLSCCYPDTAKRLIGDIPGVTIIGSGNREVQTKYNSWKKEIIVRTV